MKGQKYFFELNNFDQKEPPKVDIDLPPPPPVFSEQELADAQGASFVEGRLAGIEAEKNSRAQYIAANISALNTEVRALILAEQIREKQFEREVISVCRSLIEKLFPQLATHHGTAEIEKVIERVLSLQESSIIHIEVPMEDVEEIYSKLLAMKDVDGKYAVVGDETLSSGSCRMTWHNGGALRDQGALITSILQELDDVLALTGQKVQNNESEYTL